MNHGNTEAGMKTEYMRICGRRIRYAAPRRPGALQLLLANPHPMSVLPYTPWWETLCERFDVVAVDLPNHGGSDAARALTTVSEQAECEYRTQSTVHHTDWPSSK